MKDWIKWSLIASGMMRLASKLVPPGIAIVMYHSVLDEPNIVGDTLGGIVHSTKDFREQMEVLAGHFNPVTMDDALQFVRGEKDLPPRSVVVTFDDGYADNYQVAAPVLKQVGVPATFYVTTECVEKQCLPWPARLRYTFLNTNKPEWIDPMGERWHLGGTDQKIRALEHASQCCGKLAGTVQEDFVGSSEQQLETQLPARSRRLMMTWNEVRGLVGEGHTVGSHTLTHPNMAHVKADDLTREFMQSKIVLERELAGPVVHFSYPCPVLQPHWTKHTVRASHESGYLTAVTTTDGVVRRNDEPLCLRRIRPTKKADGLRWNLESAFVDRRKGVPVAHGAAIYSLMC